MKSCHNKSIFIVVILLMYSINDANLQEYVLKCMTLDQLKYVEETSGQSSTLSKNFSLVRVIESPDYPNQYPKEIQCIYLVHAPHGYIISLREIETFDLEPSDNCEYDALEIRDGPFGYSSLIGRYCNSAKLALPIESTHNKMWLKFNSDDTIQLRGFRIYYEFKKVNKIARPFNQIFLNCELYYTTHHFNKNSSYMLLSSEIEAFYFRQLNEYIRNEANFSRMISNANYLRSNIDCTVYIEVERNLKISVLIDYLNINQNSSKQNQIMQRPNCSENFLQIYDGGTLEKLKKTHFCSNEHNFFFKSESNRIFIRYSLNKIMDRYFVNFKINFNPFLAPDQCSISNSTFKCSDNTCINKTLVCDGIRNCNSSIDEHNCEAVYRSRNKTNQEPSKDEQLAAIHKYVLISITVVLLSLICISVLLTFLQNLKLDKKEFKKGVKMKKYIDNENETNSGDYN